MSEEQIGQGVPDVVDEVIGCFSAAEAEGLSVALTETSDERLKDLIERRLMYALYACHRFASSPPAPKAKQPLLERIAQLERELSEARKQMEAQKDEWLSWEAKRKMLEQDAERYRYAMDWNVAAFAVCRRFDDDWIPINSSNQLDASMKGLST